MFSGGRFPPKHCACCQGLHHFVWVHCYRSFQPLLLWLNKTKLHPKSVEVVEELSPEKEADHQRLELQVARAFYEAGKALSQLRARRLYRTTHKSFEEYCQERFGFNRTSRQHKIRAAEVFGNLFAKSKQPDATETSGQLFTFSNGVLPRPGNTDQTPC